MTLERLEAFRAHVARLQENPVEARAFAEKLEEAIRPPGVVCCAVAARTQGVQLRYADIRAHPEDWFTRGRPVTFKAAAVFADVARVRGTLTQGWFLFQWYGGTAVGVPVGSVTLRPAR